MAQRDYYEVLGVDRSAGEDEIKKPIASWLCATIPTTTPVTPKPNKSSRKLPRPMTSCATPKARPL